MRQPRGCTAYKAAGGSNAMMPAKGLFLKLGQPRGCSAVPICGGCTMGYKAGFGQSMDCATAGSTTNCALDTAIPVWVWLHVHIPEVVSGVH